MIGSDKQLDEIVGGIKNVLRGPAVETKVWGYTIPEVVSPHYARHKLTLKAGSWCSFHFHRHRANRFIVVSGAVKIVETYGWNVRCSLLAAGCEAEVPSLVAHQFQVLSDGEMIEEYWADRGGIVDQGDIERLTEGGIGDVEFVRNTNGIIINPALATTSLLRPR